MKEARSLACSEDCKMIIVGGGLDTDSGMPSFAAVSFDSEMVCVVEKEFELTGLSIVYSLKT